MGKLIDHRYEILKKIGEGGMGAVFLADDTRLGRRVAIKRLHLVGRESDVQMFEDRFEREARVMAQFQHPNIVSVHDYGQDDEGIFLVIEYMPEGSLTQYMQRNAISVEDAVRILLPLADALQTIHDLGRVHRDVKPANILFDPQGNPKLADFGVVKLLESDEGNTLTAAGAAVGTPAYMAPELISGDATPAADQYALGVVCYELVTGKKPFKGRTPMETMYMQKAVPMPDPLEINPELPMWVRDFLAKALAKDAGNRFRDMRAFADALQDGLMKASDEDRTHVPAPFSEDVTQVNKPAPTAAAKKKQSAVSNETVIHPPSTSPVQIPQQTVPQMQTPVPATKPAAAQTAAKKKFPMWIVWAGGGVIATGLLVIVGLLLFGGRNNNTAPTNIAVAEATQTEPAAEEIVATEGPTETQQSTATAAPTETTVPTETSTPTLVPTPTLGVGSAFIRSGDNAEMVYVPAGSFSMGSTASIDEAPVHTVTLDAYWIDKFEVTNAQYKLCVDDGVCTPPDTGGSETRNAYFGELEFGNYPVVFVDWYQADTYCAWTGGRLPTEAEWEKAARGEDERIYPWGNQPPTCDLTNYEIAPSTWCVGDTTRVGNYPDGASPFGALDMAGNLWEWVADWYAENYYSNSPEANPTGPLNGADKVLRGGAWGYYEDGVRSADRGWSAPSEAYRNGGFRCVVDAD